ncbi:MAG: class I SAM-dependent methyltransferase [Candidatus Limnocylindrales bacterium]
MTETTASETHWPDYYDVTAERPPWTTTKAAAEAFGEHPAEGPRFAVDLGCGAGRDSRELLRRGWRVLAIDMTPEGPETLWRLTPDGDRARLETEVSRLQDFEIPACDLLNANLILPFQPADDYAATWSRILAAIPVGGRFAGMLFAENDDAADDPGMTCPPAHVIRGYLDGFEIELWQEKEEDGQTALGEDHHFHLIEVVALRRTLPDVGSVG